MLDPGGRVACEWDALINGGPHRAGQYLSLVQCFTCAIKLLDAQ